MNTFEFNHQCKDSEYTYNELVTHLEEDCEHNKQLKCPSHGCPHQELMTAKQLEKHLAEECEHILVECKLCETSYVKNQLNDYKVHTCALDLNKKLVKEREAIEEAKKKLEEAKADLNTERDKVKKLDDEIKEHQEKIKKLEDDVKKANENVNKIFAAAEAKKMLDLDLPGFDSTDDMIAYNINGCTVETHDKHNHHHRYNAHNLLRNDPNYQW